MTAAVPWEGKYKEIINTDAVKYGGTGLVNPHIKTAKKIDWDGQDYCINLQIAPQSVTIFEYTAVDNSAEPQRKKEEEKLGTYTKKAVPKKKK